LDFSCAHVGSIGFTRWAGKPVPLVGPRLRKQAEKQGRQPVIGKKR
jgi:hypothetical protein